MNSSDIREDIEDIIEDIKEDIGDDTDAEALTESAAPAAGTAVRRFRAVRVLLRAFAACAALAFVCIFGTSSFAYTIDSKLFSDIADSYESMDIYYWHKGLPPENPSRAEEYDYPALITFEDDNKNGYTYFWAMTSTFFNDATGDKDGKYAWDNELFHPHPDGWPGKDFNISTDDIIISCISPVGGLINLLSSQSEAVYLIGQSYSLGENKTSSLWDSMYLDMDALDSNKTAVSFALDDRIPTIKYNRSKTIKGQKLFQLYSDRSLDGKNSRKLIGGVSNCWGNVETYWFFGDRDRRQRVGVSYYITYSPANTYMSYNPSGKQTDNKCWVFDGSGTGPYKIWTNSVIINNVTRVTHVSSKDFYTKLENKLKRKTDPIRLAHIKGKLVSYAEGQPKYLESYNNDKYGCFNVYYADPNIMSFLKYDFTVQNGQVTNLDGPIYIPQNTTITVEEGGVLSIKGWVINDGTIKVEEGGTIMVQADSCINCMEANTGRHAGRIACDGVMIVASNSKVCGGGVDGLMFGEGAMCVNYGTLISENFTVYTDHTIELRGEDSAVYAGFAFTGVGYNLMITSLKGGQTPPDLGAMESNPKVSIPNDGVYRAWGSGKLLATSSRASYSSTARSGHACDTVNGTDPKNTNPIQEMGN